MEALSEGPRWVKVNVDPKSRRRLASLAALLGLTMGDTFAKLIRIALKRELTKQKEAEAREKLPPRRARRSR